MAKFDIIQLKAFLKKNRRLQYDESIYENYFWIDLRESYFGIAMSRDMYASIWEFEFMYGEIRREAPKFFSGVFIIVDVQRKLLYIKQAVNAHVQCTYKSLKIGTSCT